jgi:hypothetical protein
VPSAEARAPPEQDMSYQNSWSWFLKPRAQAKEKKLLENFHAVPAAPAPPACCRARRAPGRARVAPTDARSLEVAGRVPATQGYALGWRARRSSRTS